MACQNIQSRIGKVFSFLGNSHMIKKENRDENIPDLPNLTAYEDYKLVNATFF